jgi:hypothetical protein
MWPQRSERNCSLRLSTLLFIPIFILIASSSFAQVTEICNNGIDDDFDGFIDCYDGSCANNSVCDGIFLGNDANCSVPPPAFPAFTMTLDFASPNETTNHFARMAVGDLDRDGMPELISMNRYTKKLFILNGNDGSIKKEATVPFEPYWEIAIGNLNNDNCAEIFFIGYLDPPGPNNNGVYLFAYDCQLNQIWQTAERLPSDPINFGLTDFDGDGLVELYAKDEIYDAHTGTRIVKTTAPNYTRINGGPVAADIMGDPRQELILGLSIYQVNLGTRTANSGSLTLLKSRPEYFIRDEYNATSIADYNLDGFIDIIASGSTNGFNQNTTIFYWDVQNDVLKTYRDLTGDYAPNGWKNGTGRVNIADLDGDGKLNASYVSGKYLYALKEDLTLHWRIVINEETSGYTGCTLFDFNGDGKSEIVYRDEQYLYIIDGTDGSIYNQQTCVSRTNREYPIVADVDADGSTELCVTCGFDDALAKANFNNTGYSRYSHIRVYKSAAEPWVPARRVWNQHGYFVVNVNDDLTIPKVLQKHQLVFSSGSCTQGPNRPLNKFLNQSPFLNSEGCPTYASPDLAFANTPTVDPPTCPDLNFTVSFRITNLGDVGLSGNIPVTFYTKNPSLPGATKLNTISVPLTDLKPNDIFDVINATVTGNGSDSLYIVLNDAGTTVPTPISLPNTNFFECDYDNIIGVKVIPKPVSITALEVAPNQQCSSPANGAARAFIPINGGGENTADYNFYWSNGAVAKPVGSADFVGPIYSGITEGTYTVYAIHKTANCNSDTVQVVINAIPSIVPAVTITVLSHQTLCNPPNGKLEAFVAGGNSGYSFTWFNNAVPMGITTSVASGLIGGNYSVLVERNNCTATQNAIVLDNAPDPDVSVTPTDVVNCQNLNSGALNAQVSIAGVTQPNADYTFNWYFYDNATSTRGSQIPNTSGPNITGLAPGYYQVVATNINTQCSSVPVVTEIKNVTIIPVVSIAELAPQTSCDPANPNGRLQASVTIGGVPQNPADFTFEWYVGQNTLPANLHTEVSGTNGSIAEKVKGGGQAYTVKAISVSQCFSTDDAVVNESLITPMVTLSSTPNGICDPALINGPPNFQGSVSASVTYAGNPVVDFTDYAFEWYNGTQAIGAKRAETTSALSSLNTGFYTLVVKRTDNACQATPKTAEVLNTTVVPVISTNAIGSTNCDPLLANGQASVTSVDGAGTGAPYVFSWHSGVDTSTPIAGATSATLANRQGGAGAFFTVLVTNQSNGCQNTATVLVPDSRVIPSITLAQTPNTICDASLTNPSVTFNGTATATVTNLVGPISGYTFTWHNGQLITDPVNATSTNQNLTNINGGYYTTVAKQTTTGCVSSPVSVQVQNSTALPVITTNVIGSTNCIPALANGQALVTNVDGAGTAAPYIFQWHTGVNTSAPIAAATSATLANRQGGAGAFFTVLVTNQSNGCQNTATVEIPNNQSLPVVTLNSSDNENCSTPFNGSASVNTIIYKGSPEALAGYSFAWTHGPTTSTISGLNAGTYELRVTRNDVGCTSNPVKVDVNNDLYLPVINVGITNQTSCDVTNPNGILSATMNETSIGGNAAETAGYTFQWTNDGNPLTPGGPAVGNTASINSLPGNLFYTVTVQRTLTRCSNTQSVFLPERIKLPRLETAATDIVDCNTHGLVTAKIFIDKNNDGDSNDAGDELTPAEYSDYTFSWFRGANTLGSLLSETDRVLNELSAGVPLASGSYTAVATNTITRCKTSDFTDVVNGPSGPLFNIDVEINNKPASCADADGVITAFVDSGGGVPAPFGSFTFQWFQGNPTNGLTIPTPSFYTDPAVQFVQPALEVDPNSLFGTPYPGSPAPQAPTGTATGPTLFGRPSGTYSVVVQRNSDGCKEFKTVFLPFLQEPVIILARIKPDECAGDVGEIEVELTAPNPASQYLLQIYPTANPTLGSGMLSQITAAATGNIFSGLSSGIYTIVARENPAFIPTACYSSPVLVNLIEALPPKVDILGSTINTTCLSAPNPGDGSLQIKVSTDENDPFSASYPLPPPPTILQKGAAPFVTYSVDVKDAGNINVPGYPTPSTFVSGDTELINGLRGETYTITVTSSKGCITTKTFDIPDAPQVADLSGDVVVLPALACDPLLETNASAEVRNLTVSGVTDNISDYQFNWFSDPAFTSNILSANGVSSPAVKGGEVLSNVGAPLPSTSVTVGSYWVRATKVIAGATGGLGCLSTPFKVDIEDQSINPSGVLTPLANTSCDASFEGSITVKVTDPGSVATPDYNYQWVTPFVSPITNSVSNGDGLGADDNFAGLSDGIYFLSFTNNASGCIGSIQTTILKSATPIVVTNATPVDQLLCNPDGSITVGANDIIVGGVVDPVHTNFDFTWSRGDATTVVVGPAQNQDVLNITNLPTIAADSYFVKVKKRSGLNPGSGCESAPFRIEILDKSVDPTVTVTPFSTTACDTNFDGALTVRVTNPGSAPSVSYDYTWTSTPAATPIANVTSNGDGLGVDDNFSLLSDGAYLITVKNNASGCITNAQAIITKRDIPIILTNATVADQLICNPDGSITVGPNDILVGGIVDNDHTRFDFTWSRGDVGTIVVGPTQNEDVLDITNLPTIGAGTYFVKVKKRSSLTPGSGCESAPVRVEILDKSKNPDISFTSIIPNSSCNLANPNGFIEATASERSGPSGTYTFAWTFNGGALPGITIPGGISPVSQLTNAGKGLYAVEVTNTLTGCKFDQSLQLDTNESLSLPNIVDITVVNPVNCFPQGVARVVSLTIGGSQTFTNPPDDIDTDYDYEWYKNSIPAGLIAGEQNSSLANQLPGTYYVQVRNLITNCISAAVETVIDSADIVYPVVSIQQISPQVICTVNVGSGALRATADGQNDTNPNYTFNWFSNLSLSGSSFETSSTITGLLAGDYSLEVQDITTNCKSSAVFILPENKVEFKPVLALSSNPLTRCDINDGSIYARGIAFPVSSDPVKNYPFAYNYQADLFVGDPPADLNNPEFPNMSNDPASPTLTENYLQENLPVGIYTVRLTDLNTGCETIDTVSVDDLRKFPVPVVNTISPVTNCDPSNPNGVARVTVEGNFVGYQFSWYEGNTVSGTPVYVGAEYGELKVAPQTYIIEAINLETTCAGTVLANIASGVLPIPAPSITLISNVTSCIFNNGALSASVGGNTKDYVFDWYDGTAEVPPPDFVGEVYDSLATGTYSVTATSRITGCKSPLVNKDVLEKKELPDFDFSITNAACDQPNGFADVFFTSTVGIGLIEWISDNQVIAVGPNLTEVFAGTYTARVTSELGCQATKDLVILADIRPRNGISRNGDSQNDYFHIDCIQEFESNNVKIFNRAGTLVYEADGYDNSNILFDGVSNRGISPIGTNVPDGTYYYIIDKRNGSKPLAGYLEIVK